MTFGKVTIEAVGEATEPTLTSEISKNFPVTMASNRAFDRAVISILALNSDGKKVYSNTEIEPSQKPAEEKPVEEKPVEEKPAKAEFPEEARSLIEEDVPIEDTPFSEEEELPIKEEIPVEKEEPAEKPAEKPADKFSSIIVNVGKYKDNPQSVTYVYENDRAWLGWAIDNESWLKKFPNGEELFDAMTGIIAEKE